MGLYRLLRGELGENLEKLKVESVEHSRIEDIMAMTRLERVKEIEFSGRMRIVICVLWAKAVRWRDYYSLLQGG